MSEVDVLVERIEAALDSRATSGQALTAQDVCQAEFTTVWGDTTRGLSITHWSRTPFGWTLPPGNRADRDSSIDGVPTRSCGASMAWRDGCTCVSDTGRDEEDYAGAVG
jgi:hypothetical protein